MAWRKLFAVGLVGSAVVVGCTVNTTNNNIGGLSDGGETGGSSNGGGGSSNGGGGTANGGGGTANGGGGTANGGGGTANGGTGTGGSGNVCDVVAGDGGDGECSKCIKTTCCAEYTACGNDADCGQNSTDDGEFLKFLGCMRGGYADAGVVNLEACVNSSANGVVLADATKDLIQCLRGWDGGKASCADTCVGTTF